MSSLWAGSFTSCAECVLNGLLVNGYSLSPSRVLRIRETCGLASCNRPLSLRAVLVFGMHPQTAAWLKDLEDLDQDLEDEEVNAICAAQGIARLQIRVVFDRFSFA